MAVSVPRIRENIQWAYSALVPPAGAIVTLSGNGYSHWWTPFPYTVPANRWLCIVSASMASKFGGIGRASYLVLDNCFTLPDVSPLINFGERTPFIVPPGTTITARLFNNETMAPEYGVNGGEAQWMNMTMTGYLVDHQPGMTGLTCLEQVW